MIRCTILRKAAVGLLAWISITGGATDTSPVQLTVDSTVGQLLDNPAARAVLQRQVPVFVQSPQINAARGLSLRSLKLYAPDVLSDAKLQGIDAELASTPGASTTGAPPKAAPPVAADFREALTLKTIPLWDGRAPDAKGDGPLDSPTLTVIGTDGAVSSGAAVIVAPGGGYRALATGQEGRQVGDWFAAHGVTAFVLSYRLTSAGYRYPVALHDAQRAIRWVRSHAAEYGLDPQRIGMIGFSAGGHLTAMASTSFDGGDVNAADPVERASSRPDFAVLAYPCITCAAERDLGLFEGHPDAKAKRAINPALNVRADTPRTFIFHTTTDEVISPTESIAYFNALNSARVPVELHVFGDGRHGLGLAMTDPVLGTWPNLLRDWLDKSGVLSPRNQ